MLIKEFTITSPMGLHARPASVLVAEAGKFKSDITLKYQDRQITAKSIIGVLALGIQSGQAITVMIEGEDKGAAMARLEKFFKEELENL